MLLVVGDPSWLFSVRSVSILPDSCRRRCDYMDKLLNLAGH